MANFGEVFKESAVKKPNTHPRSETKWLHYTKLIDNTDQYRKSATDEDIAAFAEVIRSAGKVLQDLLVRKSGPDKYEIIAGHHRRLACKYLVEVEGLKEYEFLPCKIENVDDVQAEFQLYATNAFMPKTDAEKLHEIERMKYLLEKYPDQFKEADNSGRIIEKIANIMKMGKTTVGDYVSISKNLSDKAMEQFEKGKINKSAALVLSSLPEPEQDALVDEGKTTMKAIKEHKEHSVKRTKDDSDNICETDVINIPHNNTGTNNVCHVENISNTDNSCTTENTCATDNSRTTENITHTDIGYFLNEQKNILLSMKKAHADTKQPLQDLIRQEYIVRGLELFEEQEKLSD
ncbi:ParB/RepB/Spo0J family partition protein [Agathobacter sp.]